MRLIARPAILDHVEMRAAQPFEGIHGKLLPENGLKCLRSWTKSQLAAEHHRELQQQRGISLCTVRQSLVDGASCDSRFWVSPNIVSAKPTAGKTNEQTRSKSRMPTSPWTAADTNPRVLSLSGSDHSCRHHHFLRCSSYALRGSDEVDLSYPNHLTEGDFPHPQFHLRRAELQSHPILISTLLQTRN